MTLAADDAQWELLSASEAETRAIGAAIGATLRGGEVLALDGPLGAGKTQFVKGVAAGLSVREDEAVASPTFVLVREYAGRLRLYHLDLYRLAGAVELLAIGFEELLADPAGVKIIEWAVRAPEVIPPDAVWVRIDVVDETHRRLVLAAPSVFRGAIAAALAALPPGGAGGC